MKWIYILECQLITTKATCYYIGMTEKLFTRFNEHFSGNGGINTNIFIPIKIIGLYKINILQKFLTYIKYIEDKNIILAEEIFKNFYFNNHKNLNNKIIYTNDYYILNYIVECMKINNKNNNSIHGGKYVRFNVNYSLSNNINILKNLPCCACNIPCDIRFDDINKNFYFICAKNNIWKKLQENYYNYISPCNFYEKFKNDDFIRNEIKFKNYQMKNLYKNSIDWLKNVPTQESRTLGDSYGFCICSSELTSWSDEENEEDDEDEFNMRIKDGCYNFKPSKMISFNNQKLCLCFDCFVKYNERLKKKFFKTEYLFLEDQKENK